MSALSWGPFQLGALGNCLGCVSKTYAELPSSVLSGAKTCAKLSSSVFSGAKTCAKLPSSVLSGAKTRAKLPSWEPKHVLGDLLWEAQSLSKGHHDATA